MAPKRSAAASSPKGKEGRPLKAAKVAEQEQQDIGLKFVSDLLSEFGNVSSACADMFKAALPHALGASPSDRHAFENTVINQFTGICNDAENTVAAKVKAAEERIVSLDSEKKACREKLAEAEKAASDKAEEKVASETAEKEAKTFAEAAEATVQVAQDALIAAEKDAETRLNDKAAFELAFTENFEALKEGKYSGKEWPVRNKAIKALTLLLEQASAPPSLVTAAQHTLKDKPEGRSSFGTLAVDSVETTAKDYVETMAKGIEEQNGVVASQQQALTSAQEAALAAKQKWETVQTTMFSTSNAWAESVSVVTDIQHALQALEETDPTAELHSATASLERLRSLVKSFEELRDPKPEAPVQEQLAEQV